MKTLKKFLFVFALFTCVFALTACGAKPELDFDDAEDALEDNKYMVTLVDDEDDLEPNVARYLRASTSDGDDYIRITEYKDLKSAYLAYKAMKLEYESEMDYLKLELKQYKNLLNKYEDDLDDDEIDYIEDRIDDLEEEIEEMETESKFGRSGKIVWEATEGAIEDSKDN